MSSLNLPKVVIFGALSMIMVLETVANNRFQPSVVEKLSFMPISRQLGHVIPNICVNLDASFQTFMSHWTFLVILDSVAKDHVFY